MNRTWLAGSAALMLCVVHPGQAQPAAPPLVLSEPETVKVQAAPLSDAAVTSFVKTFTEPSMLSGHIPRWAAPICLKTEGLAREVSDAVTKRAIAIARESGAPVEQDQAACTPNAVVMFEADPQKALDDIAEYTPGLLGPHDLAQRKQLATVLYPIQAWYGTETPDSRGTTVQDTKEQSPLCDSIDTTTMVADGGDLKSGGMRSDPVKFVDVASKLSRRCGNRNVAGTHLRDGIESHLSTVTVVASRDTARTHDLTAIADYVALVILSQTKAFGTCEKMDTVANLLVPGCDLDNRITGLTAGDKAFLKALYCADTGGTLVMQQASIREEMKKLLAAAH